MSPDGANKVKQFLGLSDSQMKQFDSLLAQPEVLKNPSSSGHEYESLVLNVINDNNQQRQLTFLHGLLCTIYLILAIFIVLLCLRAYGRLSSLKVVLEPWEPAFQTFDTLLRDNF
eukprot:TRINITY_DN6583_c0_g1_i1.p1 TRINITY_DN6583_c0_g1~~TRINITY_DN6583_c0_g1_i1.p1  ORF type:complete len:131 (-),score=31.67 TRINITY_DN6583_c0_g1_i1:111-455(-)